MPLYIHVHMKHIGDKPMILERLIAVAMTCVAHHLIPMHKQSHQNDVAPELMRYMYMYIHHTEHVPNTHMHDVIRIPVW